MRALKLLENINKMPSVIETKKQVIFKRGVWSEVLVVYELKEEVNCMDVEMIAKECEGF